MAMTLPTKFGRPPRGSVETRDQAVYLLSVPSGHFKVGRAKDPAGRARLLQCGNPEPISVVGASQIHGEGVDAATMERRVHELLRDYHSLGEWFRAPREIVFAAWKYAWMSLVHPTVTERYERIKGRHTLRAVAARVMGSSQDPDVLALCDAVLANVDENCPHCAARRQAKAATQKRWRRKKLGGAAAT